MKILITGDLVVNKVYDGTNINGELIHLFNDSDLNIVNLEAPITSSFSKITKTGPHLKSNKESTLKVLKLLNVGLVTLANNHILDYNQQGVADTLDFCKSNNIQTVGAGMNLKEASRTLFRETKNNGIIAIVNLAENEWSSATEESAGANPMDTIENVRQIKEAKQKSDFVFVIIHGGHEYYNLPSPRMQKQYRFYVDHGADIIIGHHTHCISGYETYKGVPIYYSLGNFLFTNQSNFNDWYIGLVLEIELNGNNLKTRLHPTKQTKDSFNLKLFENEEKEKVLNRINDYGQIIENKLKLQIEWDKYVASKSKNYLKNLSQSLLTRNRYLSKLFRMLDVSIFNKRDMAIKLNLIRCEAHRDLSQEVINKYLIDENSDTL